MSNTFLPEDYLAQKAERRTNLVCLTLFIVVMMTVFGAFLVSNKQWSKVRSRRHEINVQYEHAAMQIEELHQLEKQKEAMLHKAELAAALIERVPRSILIADLINRMPPELGLLEFHLESQQIKRRPPRVDTEATGSLKTRKRGRRPQRGKTREEAAVEVRKIEAPIYEVELVLIGVAPSDVQVAQYKGELSTYPLLKDVQLVYTEEKEIQKRRLREFEIRMTLHSDADIRSVEPLKIPRPRNPMSDTMRLGGSESAQLPGLSKPTASVSPRQRGD